MYQLRVMEGAVHRLTWKLPEGRCTVGRSDACDLALPSESVSRTHCVLDRDASGWWVEDVSRHGTFVDGERISRVLLPIDGSFEIGAYRLSLVRGDAEAAPPTQFVGAAAHEELLAVEDGQIVTCRARLRVLEGPLAGQTHLLRKRRVSVGGPGADVIIDPGLPADAIRLRVVRGRAMVEPGSRPATLDRQRLRELLPLRDGDVIRVGDSAFDIAAEQSADDVSEITRFGALVGASGPMRGAFRVLTKLAQHDAPVLILGETGTGKELAARGLHDAGPRREGPFVPLNCGAIPEALLESTLFGHEKGAFTGADKRHEGAFQRADGGTLFLDELGELSPSAQTRLLRALETGEVYRLGATRPEHPDVRVVAATHRDLPRQVATGGFRQDLLYRLAVLTVRLPPLRERTEDLGAVAQALLERDHPGARIHPEAVAALGEHHWPGNVRELRNVLTRAVVLGGSEVRPENLVFNPWAFSEGPAESPTAIDEVDERLRLIDALRRSRGNRTQAARLLGIPRTTLISRLERLGVTA